jgi:choline kinase
LNAIILSAGEGSRLYPLTKNKPKGMVNLFKKNILQWQIDTLKSCGIEDITIVKGYLEQLINFKKINYRQNKKYATTNMVETLFCATDKIIGPTIISYGDIIYEKEVLEKIIHSKAEISVIIDKNWKVYWDKRFDEPLSDAESLEINNAGYITEIGQKVTSNKRISGQYIGLIKFQGKGITNLLNFYNKSKLEAKNGVNPLNSKCEFKKSYMTDLLQGMIKSKFKIKSIEIKNKWLELDTYSDYLLYKKMEKNNTLKHFLDLNKMK